ncbi:uncharacterized protein LOC116339608 [Contarinia nasturtii]|uniref:uncharacterized protein LOC116339608 n=1 Tax=Contarinia nasturtii TaxID=265458 RepID=UPI0012D3B3C4|nr:uncharacterized protein LOC116339608 [Contarinia nasturtii]
MFKSYGSLVVVLVLSVIGIVNGDSNVRVTAPQKNPEYPNKCWDESTQTAYSVGSHNPKNSCQRIHCYPDFRIKITTCGTHSSGEGEIVEQDLSKNYPFCCAKLVKAEKKAKRVDHTFGASEVRINKFRSRNRSTAKELKTKTNEDASTSTPSLSKKHVIEKVAANENSE